MKMFSNFMECQSILMVVYVSLYANTVGKGMNPSLLYSAMNKIVEQTGFCRRKKARNSNPSTNALA